ncbi:hypothetical protein HYU09_00200 [Candidatus Woesearchaeota archaeon]|nr:hypothetical protein [Candidatus Woesearchaeota archaeon]
MLRLKGVVSLKLKYAISLLILFAFLVSACSPQAKQPVCNKPYILVGNDCCLDKDDNSICDKDEVKEETKVEETKQITPEEAAEETKTFTIQDLQADIGNVLGKTVVLTKDPELDYAQIYSNKLENSKFLGKYGFNPYSKFTIKKPEMVIQITDSKHYLNDNKDFQNFVIKNKDIFLDTALKSKEIFENEFEEGELPKLIHLKKYPKEISTAEKTKYVSHSELSSVLFYDNITFPETASGNIAEINYIKINKYNVTINNTNFGIKGYTEKLSNINYGQSIIVQCSSNLVIGLSFENYGDGSSATYERKYDGFGVTSSFFSTPLRDHYQQLIRDSQALVKMCEQRYQFTYERYR